MTENNDNDYTISTPNIRKFKSLGSRRIGTIKKNIPKTQLSESKISMIIGAKNESPKTPLSCTRPTSSYLESNYNRKVESKSTGCLPVYRLSMSKRFRSQYKKKKLDFAADDKETENSPADSILSKDLQIETKQNDIINPESVKKNNKICNQEHENKIFELKNTIEIWKTAFRMSLNDLSNKLNEDKEIILEKLQISSDMLKLA